MKVGGAGACHSDLHILDMPKPSGELAFSIPFTLGHENAGWVEKLGPGTTGFALGDPVIVYGPWGCGLCMNCRAGHGELLPTAGRSGGWRPRSARRRNGRVLARSGGTLPDLAGQPRPARRCSAQRRGADELPRHQPFASASRTRVDGRRYRRRRPGPDGDPDIAGTERHDHDRRRPHRTRQTPNGQTDGSRRGTGLR